MTNFITGASNFAQDGLNRRANGMAESASGSGSSLNATYETRQFIPHLVKEYNIKSMIDLGCGDWNWMSTIRGEFPDVEYQGWDASEEMLDENTKNYGNENTKFFYKDIIENDYPKVDMALCRDVMFHLKPEYTLRIFDNIKKAGIKYLLATSFNEIAVNKGMELEQTWYGDWRFYYINLNVKPFNLGDIMLEYVHEESIREKHVKRFLCFYDFTKK